MSIACIADTVHLYGLSSRLNEQRKDGGAFCDVLLKVSGRVLPTHACVLSACSPFFKGLICGDRPSPPHLTGAPQEIDLVMPVEEGQLDGDAGDGGGPEVVAGLIDYIYTGKISLKENTVDLVVKLAEAFMLDGLLSLVKRYVNDAAKETVSDKVAEAEASEKKSKAVGKSTASGDKLGMTKRVITLPIRRRKMTLRSMVPSAGAVATSVPAAESPCAKKRVTRATVAGRPAKNTRPWTIHTKVSLVKKKRAKYWFSCNQCRFFSSDLSAVRSHKLLHPGSTYVCVTCGFFAGKCDLLLQHLLDADHPSETRCSLCEFEAPDPAAFRQHLEKHDMDKPFLCKVCDFKCRSRSHLNAHATKHNTARPWRCEVCAATFKWKKTLQTHMLSHTKEKAFMCDRCDFRTAYKKTLVIHLRRHTGECLLKCPQEGCSFVCYDKRHLEKHVITHNNQKPYVCEVCGQKYAQEHSLKRHLKMHNRDVFTVRCEHCNYATTRNDKLREHLRKTHNMELTLPEQNRWSGRRLPFDAKSLEPPPPTESGGGDLLDSGQHLPHNQVVDDPNEGVGRLPMPVEAEQHKDHTRQPNRANLKESVTASRGSSSARHRSPRRTEGDRDHRGEFGAISSIFRHFPHPNAGGSEQRGASFAHGSAQDFTGLADNDQRNWRFVREAATFREVEMDRKDGRDDGDSSTAPAIAGHFANHAEGDHKYAGFSRQPAPSDSFRSHLETAEMTFGTANLALGLMDLARH